MANPEMGELKRASRLRDIPVKTGYIGKDVYSLRRIPLAELTT
jgi:hypothetical protein